MAYMARNFDKRLDPTLLVPGAKSVVSVLLSYRAVDVPLCRMYPRLSRYAVAFDYHRVMKDKLYHLLERLREEFGMVRGRAFVDSAPVMEREWAVRAGLGWIGKNGTLIHPQLGSMVFIGELIIDLEVDPDSKSVPNRCGTCTRCLDACPVGAIIQPGIVDSNRCIAYLNIEKRDPLTDEEYAMLNGWCFGCDACQDVCPWNKRARLVEHPEMVKPELKGISGDMLLEMDEAAFADWFADTPVERAGFVKLSTAVREIVRRKP